MMSLSEWTGKAALKARKVKTRVAPAVKRAVRHMVTRVQLEVAKIVRKEAL